MGGNEERVLVDEDVSKRIEATIVKRDKFYPPSRPKSPGTTISITSGKTRNRYGPLQDSRRRTDADPPHSNRRSSLPGDRAGILPEILRHRKGSCCRNVRSRHAPTEPVKERTVVRRVRTKSKPTVTPASTSARPGTFAAVLMLGVVWYIVAILFGDQALGRIGSWALITVSTLMVVVGAGGVFKSRSKDVPPGDGNGPEGAPTKQVLMCPKCHELVKATDRTCPDCGTEFGSN